jgi:hypothetical protein
MLPARQDRSGTLCECAAEESNGQRQDERAEVTEEVVQRESSLERAWSGAQFLESERR